MAKRGIPLYSTGKIINEETDLRVSQEAKFTLKNHLETLTKQIAKKAITFAKHAKRKTVLKEDLELAIEELNILQK